MSKFTPSMDGTPRTNLSTKIRLSEEEVGILRRLAKEEGLTPQQFLKRCLEDGFYARVLSAKEQS